MKPSPKSAKLALAVALVVAVPAMGQSPTTAPASTRPSTRPVDAMEASSPMTALLQEASEAFEGLSEGQQAALAAGPGAAAVDLDDAKAALAVMNPILDRAGELDLAAIEPPEMSVAATDLPDWVGGITPMVMASMANLSPQLTEGDEAALDAAAGRVIDVAALLRPLSSGSNTSLWFAAANADTALHQTLAGRALSVPPETLKRMADLPPLRDFDQITGEEGDALAKYMRESDELPAFLVELAEAKEVDEAEVEQWKKDWADPDRRAELIEEYDLYFAVEVELAKMLDKPEAMDRYLKEWEAQHERESQWLSRYSLMSPRSAYATQFRQRATSDLFAVLAAGSTEEDLPAALEAAGEVAGGGEIQARPTPDGRVFLIAPVPLNDEPVFLPVGQ